MLRIQECSKEAKAQIESYKDSKKVYKSKGRGIRPWSEVKIGQCFIQRFETTTETDLLASAAQQKYLRGKTFIVIKHEDRKVFEVARIA